jgi:hypothetical protein
MAKPTLEALLNSNAGDLALVVGNGINRYNAGGGGNSWEELLMRIADDCGINVPAIPQGTAITEFYDVLNLKSRGRTGDLAAEFCKLMVKWRPLEQHYRITGWAHRQSVPVLTTNFEEVLSEAADCAFINPEGLSFTDYYPWNCHFAPKPVADPCTSFGIWHINGMARYKRSIRLGLSDYMGSAQRARQMFYRGEFQLFKAANKDKWEGVRSWLHIVFHKPLLIVGLALEENEVFLRWLLIERARYFKKYPARHKLAWFIYSHDPRDEREVGKHFFLNALGVTSVRAADYDEIYQNPGWEA